MNSFNCSIHFPLAGSGLIVGAESVSCVIHPLHPGKVRQSDITANFRFLCFLYILFFKV